MAVKNIVLALLLTSIIYHPLKAMDSVHKQQAVGKKESIQEIQDLIEEALTGPSFDIEELNKIKPNISTLIKPMSAPRRQRLRLRLQEIFSWSMIHNMRLFKGNEEAVFEKYLDDLFSLPSQRTVMQSGSEKTPSEIDKEYHLFLTQSYPDLASRYNPTQRSFNDYISWHNARVSDPEDRLLYNVRQPKLLPGNYAIPTPNVGYWQSWGENLSCSQGWKIHVSAMPHSAKKIAEIVLPIARSPHYLSQGVVGKIISSIPLMRTLWSHAYIKGEETQPGKFIVLYACTTGLAYELIKKVDSALLEAKQNNMLQESDFQRLIGDAAVGQSGGVFVRYGGFTQNKIKVLLPSQIDTSSQTTSTEYDNPFFPWPDFMNKGNGHFKPGEESWRDQTNPFKDLRLEWKPYGHDDVITWETRPNLWSDLWPKN